VFLVGAISAVAVATLPGARESGSNAAQARAAPAAAASDAASTTPAAAPAPAPARAPAAAAGARTVLIGFDGASYDLAQRFIAEGKMPWAKKLMEGGSFLPLGSANPAESPVAWASINSGMNPGKTNIFGFIRRGLRWSESPGEKPGDPPRVRGFVTPMIGYNREVEAPMDGSGATMPVTSNDLRCRNYWDWLDDAGVPSRILQAACNYPAKGGERTHLLSGLSVTDVRGGPGTYLVYTSSEWETSRPTDTGGYVTRFKITCPKCKGRFTFTKGCTKCSPGGANAPEQKIAAFETRIEGPENFVKQREWDAKVKALDEKLKNAKDPAEKQQLQKDVNVARNQKQEWEKASGHASVPIAGTIDRAARTVKFELGGKSFTLMEGQWSEYVPITFQVEGAFAVKATAHVHLAQCNEKSEDVRFYLPAVTAAADDEPPNMPITSPRDFGKELVADVGQFDTIGWSCQTHALKDGEIGEASFLSAIWDTIQWRRKMLLSQLDKPDWRVLFQLFGETDRVCHMMYRYFDEKHPLYKAEDADRTARFGEREIKFRDAIPAVYQEVDATIGLVLDRIEKGKLGDCTLLVCSDHGFSPFREEVELNAWLIQAGFMTLKTEAGAPVTTTRFLQYVDWPKTKAYSVGLGTIYLNLKGREPEGAVDPADYEKTCDEIISKMREFKNPNASSANDPRVFVDGWKRSTYLSGPHATDVRDEKGRCVEGAPDIQIGVNYGYRVGWGTAMGDRSKDAVVFNNKSNWSGDHTSVHPYLVRGIFFSNRKVAEGTAPHLQDLAPTILALQGVAVPKEMDGRVLPLPGLEELSKQHTGGEANRESLKGPK
jgi:predicted AlkP superfamily phosphohydrolase/phosphomutase